ncbi:hypothetical protein STEG23_009387, partial [Scotinomys teguina]
SRALSARHGATADLVAYSKGQVHGPCPRPGSIQEGYGSEAISVSPTTTPGVSYTPTQSSSVHLSTLRITWTPSPFSIWFLAEHWVPGQTEP